MQDIVARRSLSATAIAGAAALLVGSLLHPMAADPNVPVAAFAEYAADRHWIATHLLQLAGVALMMAALVLISEAAADRRDGALALGRIGAAASLALAAALQAVDGIALKAMVNAWAAAPETQKDMLFQASFAVRQVEVGLASVFGLVGGATISLYGVYQSRSANLPRWLGFLGLVAGAGTALGGLVTAYSGFSQTAMTASMPSGVLTMAWLLALGVRTWRAPLRPAAPPTA